MKRFAVCLLLVAFLLAGCVMSLTSLRPDQDLQKNISILMKAVEQCEPDGEWRCLSIPDKNYEENKIQYIVYKHIERASWGVGLQEEGGEITLGFDGKQNSYFGGQNGFYDGMSKEEFDYQLQEWIKMVYENGDFSKAKRFEPEPPGMEI